MSAAATFAFGAGLLATVNPCGFAMLPGFLALYLGTSEGGERSLLARGAQGFCVGLALSAGFAGVFAIAGLILSLGLQSFVHAIPWIAVVIAAALVLVGFAMLAGRHVGFTAASRVRPDAVPLAGYARVLLFGAGYALASLACTVPVFLIVVGQAVAQADPLRVLVVFASYVAGTATLLVALSLSIALARAGLARAVRWLAPAVGRLAGALLVGSGGYLVIYWLPTLEGSTSAHTPGVVGFVEHLSSTLEGFLSVHTGLFVALLGALVALGTLLAAVRVSERAPHAAAEGRRAPDRERVGAGVGPAVGASDVIDAEPARTRQASATSL
jgi:cytochrome c-type biogenesis protein